MQNTKNSNSNSTVSERTTVGTFVVGKISAVTARLSLIFFGMLVVTGFFTPEKLTAKIKNEGTGMVKFGIDLGKFQALVDHFTPGAVSTLSIVDAGIIAYQYMVYEKVVNGVNVVGFAYWNIPTFVRPIIGLPSDSFNLAPIDQLINQRVMIGYTLKNPTLSSNVQSFAVAINKWIVENVRPETTKVLDLKTTTLSELHEFVKTLINDCSTPTQIVSGDATIAQKVILSTELRRTESEIVAYGNYLKNKAVNSLTVKTVQVSNVIDSMRRWKYTNDSIISLNRKMREISVPTNNFS